MIVSAHFKGRHYAVLGLARTGCAVVEALLASGAIVTAWDSDAGRRQPWEGRLTLTDFAEGDLAGYDAIIVSPGVPLNRHPIAAKAASASVPVIGDIELFAQARAALPAHKVVAITGTNGKSTTTSLIAHILSEAGMNTRLGGNIGLPILGQEPLAEGGVYVLELSSYQIDLTRSLDCDVAILLNVTPDHLDRYADFRAYADSKARLFAMQSPDHVAIIAADDDETHRIAQSVACRLEIVHGKDVADQSAWPSLQGPHNAQNVATAIAACRALGVDHAHIEAALASFVGLPHRMQRVGERNGVMFVNDSKATNAEAAAPALGAFPSVHWLLGGVAKTDNLDPCLPYFPHIKAAYTYGEASALFADLLRKAGKPVEECGTLDHAVRTAAVAARSGDVVLLAPACASFDQFSDYEARGRAFCEAVEGLT